MAGIYIHIPFCKKACFYCDFHFSVAQKNKGDILLCIQEELGNRRDVLDTKEQVDTIYFGGGTPSILSAHEISSILEAVHQNYAVSRTAETTLECNPDDLSFDYLKDLYSVGINRLSIGIQSFNDEHLTWMNRSHTHAQSLQAINDAAEVGFEDINMDLIYGLPQLSMEEWERTVDDTLQMPINHLSAYSLTLEENTPYNKLVQQKKYKRPDNDLAAMHFRILTEKIGQSGWSHYEVSNFCKSENYAKHNTAYWKNIPYLGVGPSAHSFDGQNRYWNVSNNTEYIARMKSGEPTFEMEKLAKRDRLNETILTGLRTQWGIDLAQIKADYDYDISKVFHAQLNEWQDKHWLEIDLERMRLNTEGLLFADFIASELFQL